MLSPRPQRPSPWPSDSMAQPPCSTRILRSCVRGLQLGSKAKVGAGEQEFDVRYSLVGDVASGGQVTDLLDVPTDPARLDQRASSVQGRQAKTTCWNVCAITDSTNRSRPLSRSLRKGKFHKEHLHDLNQKAAVAHAQMFHLSERVENGCYRFLLSRYITLSLSGLHNNTNMNVGRFAATTQTLMCPQSRNESHTVLEHLSFTFLA